jgi:transketolase
MAGYFTRLTAAMCQGNKLEKVREEFPTRFFDVGICESHAVAFAAGQAKVGCRPIVDIYSTFLQRSFDQIFQEVCLQNLPVVFMIDRAGLTGPDGPTHHGSFDLGYLRLFPNLAVLAPGDEHDLTAMLDWALTQNGPVAIRYPKAVVACHAGERSPIELGRAEMLVEGHDGLIVACGTLLGDALQAAARLRDEGLEVLHRVRQHREEWAQDDPDANAAAGRFPQHIVQAIARVMLVHIVRVGLGDGAVGENGIRAGGDRAEFDHGGTQESAAEDRNHTAADGRTASNRTHRADEGADQQVQPRPI